MKLDKLKGTNQKNENYKALKVSTNGNENYNCK